VFRARKTLLKTLPLTNEQAGQHLPVRLAKCRKD
jgi:hypothetical protein